MTNYSICLTAIYTSIGALVHIIRSSFASLSDIFDTPHRDKFEMNLLLSVERSYRRKITEIVLGGLVQCIEETLAAINSMEGMQLTFHNDLQSYLYFDENELVMHAAAVVREHQGNIDASEDKDSAELVERFGFPDQSSVYDHFIADDGVTLIKYCYYVRTLCMEVARRNTKSPDTPHKKIPKGKIYVHMIADHLGEFIRMKADPSFE